MYICREMHSGCIAITSTPVTTPNRPIILKLTLLTREKGMNVQNLDRHPDNFASQTMPKPWVGQTIYGFIPLECPPHAFPPARHLFHLDKGRATFSCPKSPRNVHVSSSLAQPLPQTLEGFQKQFTCTRKNAWTNAPAFRFLPPMLAE